MRFLWIMILSTVLWLPGLAQAKKLFVVTTLSTYSAIAKEIGKEKIEVVHLVEGYQDPHFMTPKPSKALILAKADLLISTGLDLELWLPSLIDKSANPRIRSGQIGYVAASHGIKLFEKPTVLSRSEGGLHIYGNPHFYNSPLTGFTIAENITIGLQKNAPHHNAYFQQNLKLFKEKLSQKLFGEKLLKLLGQKVLFRLAESGNLMNFLHKRSYRGQKLIEYAGGWLQIARKFYQKKVVTYHKNWSYFSHLFGLEIVEFIEPKPGIPPSPKHVQHVLEKMKQHQIKVIIAANYYPEDKIRQIAEKVQARPVILGITTGGEKGMSDYFTMFDIILKRIATAFTE